MFAAQNHRSPKFSSLQCTSCDKTFSNTIEHKKHIKTEHAGDAGVQPRVEGLTVQDPGTVVIASALP